MKATANREGLLTAFQIVAGVVPARSPKPILKSVKLELGDDGAATLMATDLELGIRYRVSGLTVDEPGTVILPAAEMMSILRELPDESIVIEDLPSGIKVSGASSRFELPPQDPLGYPDVPDFEDKGGQKIKSGQLATMIRRTIFAVAPENSRYALHSVLFEFSKDNLNLVATDGKRLARMPGKATFMGERPEGSWLVPPKALSLVLKSLVDPEEELELALRENEVLFRTGKTTIYSRLVEGRFPNYMDVFPPPANIRIPLPVSQFYAVVRQARIVTRDESKGVEFLFEPGMLTLTSRGQDAGEAEIRLPVGYEGESIKLIFDPQLLVDALRVLDSDEEVSLDLVDNRRAAVFRSRDEYEYVVMPLTKDR
ncbi:MAG: DNA polymerase III subunit beta [Planctomycetota bacterium]